MHFRIWLSWHSCFLTYSVCALVVWAIFLINDHWIADILHDNTFKVHIGGTATFRCWPALYSYTIQSTGDGAVGNKDTLNRQFIVIPSKTSNTDSMARSTCHFAYVNFFGTITNWDAIVPGSYVWICDDYSSGMSNVNTISVGTVPRCCDCEVLECYIVASEKIHVKQFAVQRS